MSSLTKRDTLLDVGCGAGIATLDFALHVFEAFGVDVSPAMLELAERSRIARNARNVEFRWGEATRLPFPTGAIDVLFCQDLLRYLPDPTSFFAECRRLLAPGGRLLLDEAVGTEDPVRRATQEAIELVRDPAVVKLYGLEDIRRALLASDLSITKLDMYEKPETMEDWLDSAATPDLARQKARLMMEASLETDAAGLHAQRDRSGSITFRQSRARVLTSVAQGVNQ
jgi:ubiquinone/menaquinone biosynthesis C-methylase UbiE